MMHHLIGTYLPLALALRIVETCLITAQLRQAKYTNKLKLNYKMCYLIYSASKPQRKTGYRWH